MINKEQEKELSLKRYKRLLKGAREFLEHLERVNERGEIDRFGSINGPWLVMGCKLMRYERSGVFKSGVNNERNPI